MRFLLALLFLSFISCGAKKEVIATEEVKEAIAQEAEETLEELLPMETPSGQKVSIMTEYGQILVLLYDETPLHQANFLKLVEEGFYEDLLFHRVIRNFMIQGGDPNSRDAKQSTRLGSGSPGYTVPAEFNTKFIHKKGALAAARTNNPTKASSGSQFYLVQGKVMTDAELDQMELRVQATEPGFKYTEEQREIYKTQGGTPFLDMNYTVYGEVLNGLEVIDEITKLPTTGSDRPLTDVKMSITRMK